MSFPHSQSLFEEQFSSTRTPYERKIPALSAPVPTFASLSSVPQVVPETPSCATPPVMVHIDGSRSLSSSLATFPIAPLQSSDQSLFVLHPSAVLRSNHVRFSPVVGTTPQSQPSVVPTSNHQSSASQINPFASSAQSSLTPSNPGVPFLRLFGGTPDNGGSPITDRAPHLSPYNFPGPQAPAETTGASQLAPAPLPAAYFLGPITSPVMPAHRPVTTTPTVPPSHALSEVLGPITGPAPISTLPFLGPIPSISMPALRPVTTVPAVPASHTLSDLIGPTGQGRLLNFAEALLATHPLGDLSFLAGEELAAYAPDEPEEAPGTDPVLKVASRSNIHTLAGAIAKRLRSGRDVQLVAIGPESVNQAVKAIAVTRSYLEDDPIDLVATPEFLRVTSTDALQAQRSAVRFTLAACPNNLTKGEIRDQRPTTDPLTSRLKVAGTSSPAFAAGAIAERVRLGARCAASAMGPESVNQTVKAVALARIFLRRDHLDVTFQPKFILLSVGEAEARTGLEMVIQRR